MIEKNEKSGELMEVKEQAKTVRKYPERMIVRIWLVLALICLLAGLISQYTFRLEKNRCFCTTASRLIWAVGWTE